jgi:hypothetical protein
MNRWQIPAFLGILFCLSAASVFAMTCEECKEIEKDIASASQERTEQEAELQRVFSKRDVSKASQIERRIATLSKKLAELERTKAANCKDACKPEVIKKTACGKLLSEIAEMEADAAAAENNKASIDDKYKALLNCHKELQRLTGKNK